ncbi:MAG: hypothetical protein MJZ91_10605 [Bacteroidales bacterium]|nr:hypothetical protein [Bacteroidales bacterium]
MQTDTVYLRDVAYDSVYVLTDRTLERGPDTIRLTETNVVYRYRLRCDTVRLVERDSIPYTVTVVETREVAKPTPWYDKVSRWGFLVALAALASWVMWRKK